MASSGFRAEDGHWVSEFAWHPETAAPRGVIQILHGLGEHASRYERFARACKASGLAVWAHDHRGHGARPGIAGHFADRRGWDKVLADVLQVNERIRAYYDKLPVVLLGHSMGSYIAQSFVLRHPAHVSALILSASTFAGRSELQTGHWLAKALTVFGRRRKSGLLNQMGFGKFNHDFQPARTNYDWLSRDEDEVDRYIADPLCGGLYSNALWRDLTGGLLEITSRDALQAVPVELPVLIIGGEKDPVGGESGMNLLANAYRDTGHQNVELTIYPGGRHEMLNEVNRRAVTKDLLAWVQRRP